MANLKDLIVNGSARILGTLYANVTGNVTGNCSGSSGSCTGNAATANRLNITDPNINIQTGSTTQSHITLQTLMTWLITTKGYIPSNTHCYKVLKTSWSYANNDILQLSIGETNYELTLAGVIIEFMGYTTAYNSGVFRLLIHSASHNDGFTPTSGYTKFPTSHTAEYTCNGSVYSPTWKMLATTNDDITGNAATATKATQDASGNVITTTYATKTELSAKLDIPTRYVVAKSDKSILPSWWTVYSDGWCEQGGFITGTAITNYTVSLIKQYSNTNYTVTIADHVNSNGTGGYSSGIDEKTTTSFMHRGINTATTYGNTFDWRAEGYTN